MNLNKPDSLFTQAGSGESLRVGSQTWVERYLCPLSLHYLLCEMGVALPTSSLGDQQEFTPPTQVVEHGVNRAPLGG